MLYCTYTKDVSHSDDKQDDVYITVFPAQLNIGDRVSDLVHIQDPDLIELKMLSVRCEDELMKNWQV